jgi:hypothetical protein
MYTKELFMRFGLMMVSNAVTNISEESAASINYPEDRGSTFFCSTANIDQTAKLCTKWIDVVSQKTTTTWRHVLTVSFKTKFDCIIIFCEFFVIVKTKMNVGISCADGICQ